MSAFTYPPARTHPLDPAPALTSLRLHDPVSKIALPKGETAWLITRHADVCAVLRDRRFSSDPHHPNFGSLRNQVLNEQFGMGRMDDPAHHELRRRFTPDFLATSLAKLRPDIQRIIDGEVDTLLASTPPVDLVPGFALRIPALVVCRMLGIGPDELEFFTGRTAIIDSRSTSTEEAQRADAELFEFTERLIARHEREPADNMVGRLLTTSVRDGELSREGLISQIRVLIMAGHLTTFNMIALSLLSVLEEPKRFQMIAERPEMIGNAVVELMRYHTVSQDGVVRLATEDVRIGGVTIRSGDNVVVSLASANRDSAVFPDPDTLDFERDARPHVAFGHGPHMCLGRQVALTELEIMLATVARRIPTLRLAVPVDALRFRHDRYIYGLKELPVTW